ncbi:MAG: AAA family ATPase, partial [Ferruginibacter sp.]
MASLQSFHKEILLKKEILNKTKNQLKAEFIGIDQVIDEVIDNISSWYFFPSLQTKPVVINLWGLTGVGKSSLVKRIAALISFDEKFYQFDLGATKEIEWDMKQKLENIYKNVNGYPVIIALDEFQHARTLNESGNELEKSASRVIWELMDSGQFQAARNYRELENIYSLTLKLKHLLTKGVTVKKGEIITKKEFFANEMKLLNGYKKYLVEREVSEKERMSFVPDEFHETIYGVAREKFANPFDVKLQLNKLNGHETIDFLIEIFEFGNSPKTIDCSKALVFVLGNLDDAYYMSSNYNPDMDADEFHEQSLKINLTQIKKALRYRFRNEQ